MNSLRNLYRVSCIINLKNGAEPYRNCIGAYIFLRAPFGGSISWRAVKLEARDFETKSFRPLLFGRLLAFASKRWVVTVTCYHGRARGDSDVTAYAMQEEPGNFESLDCLFGSDLAGEDRHRLTFHRVHKISENICVASPLIVAIGDHQQRSVT